jgi:hypothetical protein
MTQRTYRGLYRCPRKKRCALTSLCAGIHNFPCCDGTVGFITGEDRRALCRPQRRPQRPRAAFREASYDPDEAAPYYWFQHLHRCHKLSKVYILLPEEGCRCEQH